MQENLDLGWQRYGTRRRKSLFALFCCGSLGLRTFLWLFSTVRFQMSSQIACLRKGIFAVVAYIVKCLFKLFAWKDARSHSLNLFGLFPVCFSNVSTNGKTRRMQSHTRCVCPIFLHFTFTKYDIKDVCSIADFFDSQHSILDNRFSTFDTRYSILDIK